jgi:hypothetical protein
VLRLESGDHRRADSLSAVGVGRLVEAWSRGVFSSLEEFVLDAHIRATYDTGLVQELVREWRRLPTEALAELQVRWNGRGVDWLW